MKYILITIINFCLTLLRKKNVIVKEFQHGRDVERIMKNQDKYGKQYFTMKLK